MPNEVLRLFHAEKLVDGYQVLRDVHLNLYESECHGVLIHHDAARDMLADILTGAQAPDRGALWVDDRRVALQSPLQARSLGIYSIRPQSQLIPNLSISENLFLTNDDYYQNGFANQKLMHTMARELLAEAGLAGLHPDMPAYALKSSEAHLVELLKVMAHGPRILLLDNFFHHYTQREFGVLAALLSRRREGCAVLLFSSQYNPIFQLVARITVFRKSSTAITLEQHSPIPHDVLLAYQTPKRVESHQPPPDEKAPAPGELLRAEMTLREGKKPFHFTLYRQEVLGLFDEEGYLYRKLPAHFRGSLTGSGELAIDPDTAPHDTIRSAKKAGLFMIQEPGSSLLFHNLSLAENIALTTRQPAYNALGFSKKDVMAYMAQEALTTLRAEALWEAYGTEKYMPHVSRSDEFIIQLARFLCSQSRILFLMNPQLHFDDLSIRMLPSLIRSLRERASGLVIFSFNAEVTEACCDRMLRLI